MVDHSPSSAVVSPYFTLHHKQNDFGSILPRAPFPSTLCIGSLEPDCPLITGPVAPAHSHASVVVVPMSSATLTNRSFMRRKAATNSLRIQKGALRAYEDGQRPPPSDRANNHPEDSVCSCSAIHADWQGRTHKQIPSMNSSPGLAAGSTCSTTTVVNWKTPNLAKLRNYNLPKTQL